MGIFNLFKKKETDSEKGWRVGGMEDFMTLIRVYYQAVMASQLGISNLAALPDLRIFKQTLHVPTQNNKLGLGEKNRCKKMLSEIYGISDEFFKEIDKSIKRNCRTVNDVRSYFVVFQGFSQDTMMLMGNLMKFKLRVPSFFKRAIYTMTEKTVNDIFTKNDYKDAGVARVVMNIRQYNKRLNFSQKWITDFVYQVVMLAKKEPKAQEETTKK